MKRLMIIDSLNLFMRNYHASGFVSANGPPVGGLIGYLRSLQKYIRDIRPDEIIVVWDGPGGSTKKRKIYNNYKAGRKPVKINRGNSLLTEEDEERNILWQQSRLFEYLNNFPIIQVLEPQVEADDLIAFVARNHKYDGWAKIIVSSDKDFIQLCDKETVLYRPMQGETLTWKSVVENFGIHPNNFTIARAMEGDKSDNIAGVKGVGLKSVKKYLPFLSESKTYLIADIEKYCRKRMEDGVKTKFYNSVLDNLSLIRQNYNIMQLYTPNISAQVAQSIRKIIQEFIYEINITETKTMLMEDRVGENNFEEMYAVLRRIVVENK